MQASLCSLMPSASSSTGVGGDAESGESCQRSSLSVLFESLSQAPIICRLWPVADKNGLN